VGECSRSVYIKRIELCNFKSFGGATGVPFLPGFTVISGPNGSGKSNILDALLFALGLSSSKGMRADRLPDLVNHAQIKRGRSVIEASVTVTFDLEGLDPNQMGDEEDDGIRLPELEDQDQVDLGPVSDSEPLGDPESEAIPAQPEVEADPLNGAELDRGADPKTPATTAEPGQNGQSLITEWTVTRKLRVTSQGTYTSTYYLNGQPCTLTELHEQLHRLRIYPEGYNVVLQGDVTSIISMNPRERREIIDELAGVAAFDRKINQARDKLNAVKEREDRFRIVETELTTQRDRLAQDRVKAQKYQKLRAEFAEKSQWESVIQYHQGVTQYDRLRQQISADDCALGTLAEQLTALADEIHQSARSLEELNAQVKMLGEEEQLAIQATLASREAELRQLQRQHQEVDRAIQTVVTQLAQTQRDLQQCQQDLVRLEQEQQHLQTLLGTQQRDRDAARQTLDATRESASEVASASEAGVQQQAELHHQIESCLQVLEPQRAEQARLQERRAYLEESIQTQTEALAELETSLGDRQQTLTTLQQETQAATEQAQQLAQVARDLDQNLRMQQQTQTRLLQEQRDKQRRLDRLEAQAQVIQESQGTRASRVVLQSDLPGICGLVAQLGQVDPQYQLALETAAGARLANLVVEDDGVAAAAIALLKAEKAGRATFLPLNKLARARSSRPHLHYPGFIDYAVNLIEFDPRYRDVFDYVFSNTAVFDSLDQARRCLGQVRIVTLQGELLEVSGAMTGGSSDARYTLHFGTMDAAESAEILDLRQRLADLDPLLDLIAREIETLGVNTRTHQQLLQEATQQARDRQFQDRQVRAEYDRLQKQRDQTAQTLIQHQQELNTTRSRLETLAAEISTQEHQLQQWRWSLAELEQSQAHAQWQQIQTQIRLQEATLQEKELALRTTEQRQRDLANQRQRLQEQEQHAQQRLQGLRTHQTELINQQSGLDQQQADLTQQIQQAKAQLAQLDQTLSSIRQQRDRAERQLRDRQTTQQQLTWQQQKLQETQQTRRQQLLDLQEQLATQQAELPNPLPEVPTEVTDLAALQHELRSLQKRIQGMEPVNMLALEEYERTQERLAELSQKLTILDEERTELLLRIENFTTLRQQAFKEAFDAVNYNFQQIFAELSDGDGYLQLENVEDPFSGGLNLVAHPKGKPVQRLASMSGGEKSLTALSFIFALQRYRPSPFYAFDEVDMFLDGANVERLARMIRQQAEQAQFIVVSLRRPMIESSERTIGVTQARGAYTQVLGIKLQPASI